MGDDEAAGEASLESQWRSRQKPAVPGGSWKGVAPANRFLSWHMAGRLVDLVDAQRKYAAGDLTREVLWWNNLFAIRQVRGSGCGMVGAGCGVR